jgi:hypothetical protein
MAMTRREFFAMAALPALARPTEAMKQQSTFYFVLIDTSLTVVNFDAYRNAWPIIENHFQGGDRMVIALVKGQVSHQPSTIFRKIDDRQVLPLTWRDNAILFQTQLKQARGSLRSSFGKALCEPRSTQTELIRSLKEAGKFFAAEKERKRTLLILSDMLEDSEEYKFARTRISPQFIQNVLAETRQNQRMPNLEGVQVYVIGANAPTETKAEEVEKFWVTYLQASGSSFRSENYGSSLIQID